MSRLLPALVLLLSVASAHALTVDAARLQLGGKRGDTFRLQGRFDGGSLATADMVAFRLDTIAIGIPRSAFTQKKSILTFKGAKGSRSLGLLRLDLKKGTFLATGRAWPLASLTSPFAVAVGADCGMVVVAQKGKKPRTTGKRMLVQQPSARAPGGCGLGTPQLRPITARVGVPTALEVVVPVAGGEATSLQLRRAGSGDALCTLAPVDGDATRQGCTVTISEAAPTTAQLWVEGRGSGGRTTSPGVSLPVLPEATDDEVAATNAAIEHARQVWLDARARLGDVFEARMDAIATLLTVPGIADAGLSANGVDIVLRFATGWEGFLILNRPVDGQVQPAPSVRRAPAPAARRPAPRGVFRSCGDGEDVCCPIDQRTMQERRDVVLFKPGFIPSDSDDAVEVERILTTAGACLGFQITRITGDEANIDSLSRLSDFSTVVISTHGTMSKDRRTRICVSQKRESYSRGIRRLLYDGDAGLALDPYATLDFGALCISEDYMRRLPGRFPEHAIVYASYCYSAARGMPAAFLGRGAGTFYGYDLSAGYVWTRDVLAPALWNGLVKDFLTTGKAYDTIDPKTDPADWGWTYPNPEDPTKYVHIPGHARVLLLGDPNVAYVGRPELAVSADQIRGGDQATFELEVPGAESCELTNHWHNTADYGHLDGGDDVETSETSYTFTARDDAFGGSDGIGVEVLPKDGEEPVGVACSGVFVSSTCGDAIWQPDYEQCDGLDSLGCPAGCNPDCTCKGTTTSSSVTTTTTSTTSTTLEPPECETSNDCDALACCSQEGFCCSPGDPCPPSGGPIVNLTLVCGYTNPPSAEELTPIAPNSCGPSTPAFCPAEAYGAITFVCQTCADNDKYLGYLLENGVKTPYP